MTKLKDLLILLREEKIDTKEFTEFAETRGKGAEKIVDSAKEKGGLALLTWHHFKVKLPYYKKASEGKLDIDNAKSEYKVLLENLYAGTSSGITLTQTEFQELLGKMEVLGELIINEKTND